MPAPKLDSRTYRKIVDTATALARRLDTSSGLAQGYVPDWTGVQKIEDPARRLIDSFARLMEILIERENRIPEKNFVRFLDLVGVEQFPGSPAKVPLTFLLANGATASGRISERTQVATTQTESASAQVFETVTDFFATPARIARILSIVPSAEGYNDVPLGELPPTEEWLADAAERRVLALTETSSELADITHVLYVASETLFGREELVDVVLVFSVTSGDATALKADRVKWMRYDEDTQKWTDLSSEDESDSATEVRVRIKDLVGAGKVELHGRESRFLAGHALDTSGTLPEISQVSAILEVPASLTPPSVVPELAFANGNRLDLSAPFRPFGERPKYGDVFYLGSVVALGPEMESLTLSFSILPHSESDLQGMFADITGTETIDTVVEWQYLDTTGVWRELATFTHGISATAGSPPTVASPTSSVASGSATVFAGNGTLFGSGYGNTVRFRFGIDTDIGLNEVNGVDAYWVRAILRNTEPYGSDGFIIPGTSSDPAPVYVGPLYVAPVVGSISLEFEHRQEPVALDVAITENNFEAVDRTEALGDPTASFAPFVAITDVEVASCSGVVSADPAIYVALDHKLENDFVSFFVHLDEPASVTTAPLESGNPHVEWEYFAESGLWRPLDVQDGTADLKSSGPLAFLAPADSASLRLFPLLFAEGTEEPYWLRARLASGSYDHPPRVLGIYLNTVLAENRATIADGILIGSSSGRPGQVLSLVRTRILAGDLWVREPERPTDDELEQLRVETLESLRLDDPDAELGAEDLLDEDEAREIWVRWHRVANFLSSSATSRHYTFDMVNGILTFGDDSNGLVAPVGKDNLVLRNFVSGGGEDANRVALPLAAKEMKSSLPFVDKVFNVAQAIGGADAWSMDETLRFGPQSIKNRGRAVTREDYEWMVLERFSQVDKVRCLATSAPEAGGVLDRNRPGAATVIVVPSGTGSTPQPSAGLLREIRAYLQEKTLGSIIEDIHVIGPSYRPTSVTAVVKVLLPEEASLVARRVVSKLETYLHPLTGGDQGNGWEFGRDVRLSEVFALIASVDGVDYVESASFLGEPDGTVATVDVNSMAASGAHEVEVK